MVGDIEAHLQSCQIRQLPGIEAVFQCQCEFRFTGVRVGKPEQTDHDFAGSAPVEGFRYDCPSLGIGRSREQLVAIDEIGERLWLAAKAVNDVPIVDDVAALTLPTQGRSSTRKRECRTCSE